jgi:hypothetical protein
MILVFLVPRIPKIGLHSKVWALCISQQILSIMTNSINALRLIYTSDFRARFHSKLVPFTEYSYFYI